MAKWQDYEEQVFAYLRGIFPEETRLLRGQHLKGRYSRTKRQVDILALIEHARRNAVVVIECKCFSTKICVPRVDTFAGFLDDVNADLGMMITTKGFSRSVLNRAKAAKKIILKIVNLGEAFQRMHFFGNTCCQNCNVNRTDCPLTPIEWHWPPLSFVDEDRNSRTMLLGRCSSCQDLYVDCCHCTRIIRIRNNDLNRTMSCPNCGIRFRVVPRRGLPKLELIY